MSSLAELSDKGIGVDLLGTATTADTGVWFQVLCNFVIVHPSSALPSRISVSARCLTVPSPFFDDMVRSPC